MSKNDKPTDAEIAVLRLSARDGGTVHRTAPTPTVVRCIARHWIDEAWTLTPAGRAVLATTQEQS